MHCFAIGGAVQIEAETDGVRVRNSTCGAQSGCHRYMRQADLSVGPCILIEDAGI
jgi:hypothetical protein